MPQIISGLRIARSYLTPAATSPVTTVLDFQLGARMGIQIEKIAGSMNIQAITETTALVDHYAIQTLHLESGTLEDVVSDEGDDENTIDSEIMYRQDMSVMVMEHTTGGSAAALLVTPNAPLDFQTPLFVARNPTHAAVTNGTSLSIGAHLTIYYKFVQFSLSELGLILARRT